jgi:outer membrane lipoprotein LolB
VGAWTAGRIALSVAALPDRPAQSFAAAFELRGDDTQGELRLFSPLGTQLAAARWRPGLAELDTGDGARRFADPDALGREALGEAVPLAALPDWVAGRAWVGAPSRPLEAGFEQLGWAVDLSRRGEGRIVARRETPPAVTVRIALTPPA